MYILITIKDTESLYMTNLTCKLLLQNFLIEYSTLRDYVDGGDTKIQKHYLYC